MKIAILLPNWLGDVVMATPTLRALRRRFGPRTQIVGIMRPYLADVLGGTDWLDEQWYFDPRSTEAGVRMMAVARRMRCERFDMAVLLPNSLRSGLLAWLGRVKQRIGYVRHCRGLLLTGKAYPRRRRGRVAPAPTVETYLGLARLLGCPPESPRLELATTAADERSADMVFRNLGLRQDGRLVTLNASGAYGGTKLWPVEYFGQLATRIAEQLDHDVLVMCGPGEREVAHDIVRLAGSSRVFCMADQPLDLGTAKACIRRGRMMVSTDSGPRHVAAAFGKPMVTLYGPILPIWSRNPTQHAVDMIRDDLPCIGCHRRVCPLGHHNCMRQLSVDSVYGQVVKILEGEKTSVAA